jgi:hypothetical protein
VPVRAGRGARRQSSFTDPSRRGNVVHRRVAAPAVHRGFARNEPGAASGFAQKRRRDSRLTVIGANFAKFIGYCWSFGSSIRDAGNLELKFCFFNRL